jgi:hypothetical protein
LLPKDVSLDGYLTNGQSFDDSMKSIQNGGDGWNGISFVVFDAPSMHSITVEDRLEALTKLLPNNAVR